MNMSEDGGRAQRCQRDQTRRRQYHLKRKHYYSRPSPREESRVWLKVQKGEVLKAEEIPIRDKLQRIMDAAITFTVEDPCDGADLDEIRQAQRDHDFWYLSAKHIGSMRNTSTNDKIDILLQSCPECTSDQLADVMCEKNLLDSLTSKVLSGLPIVKSKLVAQKESVEALVDMGGLDRSVKNKIKTWYENEKYEEILNLVMKLDAYHRSKSPGPIGREERMSLEEQGFPFVTRIGSGATERRIRKES